MRKLYTCPEAETVEFDIKDVITTSGETDNDPLGGLTGGTANGDDDWTGFY